MKSILHFPYNARNIIAYIKNENTRTANASKHIIYSFILQAINIIISFLYVPLFLSYLSQEKYGIWLTMSSIMSWFSFFDIGLGNGLRNKLTEALAKDERELGKSYVSTVYALLAGIFVTIILLFNCINLFVDWSSILNTNVIGNNELFLLTSIVFTFFMLRFVFQIIGVIYIADQKPSFSNLINTISSLITLILVYVSSRILNKGDLVFMGAMVSSIPVFVFVIFSVYSYNHRYKFLKPSIKSIDITLSKGLMNLGFRFLFLQITSIIIYSTSSIFISQLFGPKEVVIYNITYRYFQLPVMIFSIILSPIWSAVTDAYFKNDFKWLKDTLKQLNVISLLMIIVVLSMIYFSRVFFNIWIGDKITIPLSLIICMALYTSMNVILSPFSTFINGLGKIKLTMMLTIVGISLYLVSIIVLQKYIHSSILVVLSMIITSLIGIIIQPLQVYKILNRNAYGVWNK